MIYFLNLIICDQIPVKNLAVYMVDQKNIHSVNGRVKLQTRSPKFTKLFSNTYSTNLKNNHIILLTLSKLCKNSS